MTLTACSLFIQKKLKRLLLFIEYHIFDNHGFTTEKLLFVVEAVPLDSGEFMFMLLDNFLQSAVQILLLLLKKLLFLDG